MFIKRGMPVFIVTGLLVPVAGLVLLAVLRAGPGPSPSTQDIVVGVLIAAGIFVLPLPVVPLVARSFGWSRLARHFARTRSTPPDHRSADGPNATTPPWREMLCTITFNKPIYSLNNCVRWAEDEFALTLHLDAPFHLGLPKLTIPWDQVGAFRVEEALFQRMIELLPREGKAFPVRLLVPEELVAAEIARRSAEGPVTA
jgi:hypothetical protein